MTLNLDNVDVYEDILPAHKSLGLVYDSESNRPCVKVAIRNYPSTRRGLLSVMASVYNPLRMPGPFMLPVKLRLRQPTDKGFCWDKEISEGDCLILKKIDSSEWHVNAVSKQKF